MIAGEMNRYSASSFFLLLSSASSCRSGSRVGVWRKGGGFLLCMHSNGIGYIYLFSLWGGSMIIFEVLVSAAFWGVSLLSRFVWWECEVVDGVHADMEREGGESWPCLPGWG